MTDFFVEGKLRIRGKNERKNRFFSPFWNKLTHARSDVYK